MDSRPVVGPVTTKGILGKPASSGLKREMETVDEMAERTGVSVAPSPPEGIVYMQPRSKARVVPPPPKVKAKGTSSGLVSFRIAKSSRAAKATAKQPSTVS